MKRFELAGQTRKSEERLGSCRPAITSTGNYLQAFEEFDDPTIKIRDNEPRLLEIQYGSDACENVYNKLPCFEWTDCQMRRRWRAGAQGRLSPGENPVCSRNPGAAQA